MTAMRLHRLIPAAAACIGVLAIAAPPAGADSPVPGALPCGIATPAYNPVCTELMFEGPMAVLGPYGVLGDYGPLGTKSGQKNPATDCYSGSMFGTLGFGVPFAR
jgi:hypothetical protein